MTSANDQPGKLRVVDDGNVGAHRSQALWHGIASAMRPGAAPTLSFCRPIEPYVGLGFHRSLDEIDLRACRRLGLPVIRRRIGGGPVYLDSDQLFFQLTLPADRAPVRIDRLYELCLEPAAAAFRSLGLSDARRNGINDLAVDGGEAGPRPAGPRKVSGTGAGRIGDGVTVVGNVLFRFPHARMVEVLALATGDLRRECLRLMERHVSSLAAEGLGDVGFAEARAALIEAYARAFGRVEESSLTAEEESEIRGWQERFHDPAWLAGPPSPAHSCRRIKISADAAILAASDDGLEIEASISCGRLVRVSVDGRSSDSERMSAALDGQPATAEDVGRALESFGAAGLAVLRLLEPGLEAL